MSAAKYLDHKTGLDPDRRRFFRRGLGNHDLEAASFRNRPLSAERIALLREFAACCDAMLPASAIPEIRIGERCMHHKVCVAACPTGALRAYSGTGEVGLEFDAAACIACGICSVVCPDHALTLRARAGDDRSPSAVGPVSRHALRACARCDDEFTARGEDELCPACRKDIALFATGLPARSEET